MKNPRAPFCLSRRQFALTLAAGTAAASIPMFIPVRLLGANAPSNRVRVGQIGCGRIAQGHDLPGVLKSGLADVVAVCDVDSKRAAAMKLQIETFYREANTAVPDVRTYVHYEDLLRHPDLDAVVISTPDHAHAELALAAILAGKDVYLQKPFTMTLEEGRLLRDAVAASDRICR